MLNFKIEFKIFNLFLILICVNGLTKSYYFLNDEESNEELSEYQKEESNENNDFKFDDQSSFKVSSLICVLNAIKK